MVDYPVISIEQMISLGQMISIGLIINGVGMFLNMLIKQHMTFTIDDTFYFPFFIFKTNFYMKKIIKF